MGKKELKKIIEKRVLSGEYRIMTGDACETDPGNALNLVCRQLGMLSESELPFYYSKTGRNVLVVDHVAFDAKNSFSRQTESLPGVFLKERRILKKSDAVITGQYKILPPVSKGPYNAKSYLINFLEAFRLQYERLDDYKRMMKEEGICRPACRIKTCFFIEDTTPLGSYILNADGMSELVLLYVKQFLDLYENAPGLDYVFFGCFKGCSDSLWFMSREDIKCFRKKETDLMRRNYFAFDVKNFEETI